jgi:hypothetical protein
METLVLITERIEEDGSDPGNVGQHASMTLTIREEYLAMLFFVHANSTRYGSLVANAQNDFVTGVDKYPKTVSKACDNPSKSHNVDHQDAGMLEGNNRNAGCGNNGRNNAGGRGRGGGANRNNSGNNSGSGNDEGHDNHANMQTNKEEQDVNSATNSSTNNYAYSLNVYSVEQVVLMHNLPRMWLLIDSCSTTDIFANKLLLTNVHDAPTPIWVRCNAGRIQLKQQGYFGNYPQHPVWYNPKGVANILSLANVTKHYRVTMDSATSPVC